MPTSIFRLLTGQDTPHYIWSEAEWSIVHLKQNIRSFVFTAPISYLSTLPLYIRLVYIKLTPLNCISFTTAIFVFRAEIFFVHSVPRSSSTFENFLSSISSLSGFLISSMLIYINEMRLGISWIFNLSWVEDVNLFWNAHAFWVHQISISFQC